MSFQPTQQYTYRWVRTGYAHNKVTGITQPIFGFMAMLGNQERGNLRCVDIWPLLYGPSWAQEGCGCIQLYNEPTRLRCYRCHKDMSKNDIRVLLAPEGMPAEY